MEIFNKYKEDYLVIASGLFFGLMGIGYLFRKKYVDKINKLKEEINDLNKHINDLKSIEKHLDQKVKSLNHQSEDLETNIQNQIADFVNNNRKPQEFRADCLICFEENVPLVSLVPCGHIFACEECIKHYKAMSCYICQQRIQYLQRVYLMVDMKTNKSPQKKKPTLSLKKKSLSDSSTPEVDF